MPHLGGIIDGISPPLEATDSFFETCISIAERFIKTSKNIVDMCSHPLGEVVEAVSDRLIGVEINTPNWDIFRMSIFDFVFGDGLTIILAVFVVYFFARLIIDLIP